MLLCHVASTTGSPIRDYERLFHKAAVGVDVFFVISGFLITTLLIREREAIGRVSLGGFWKRRALRILPAFIVYLAALAILDAAGWVNLVSRDWIAAMTYTVNFATPVAYPVNHIWSLSLEEHFYLVWPILFVVLGVRRAALLAFIALLFEPIIRWGMFRFGGGVFDIDFVTFARYDAIAAGCVLAVAAHGGVGRQLLARWEARPVAWFFAATALLAISVFVLNRSGKYVIFCYPLVNAAAISCMVWTAIRCPHTIVGRVLNLTPLGWLGRLSYSLYLWQQLFLDPTNGVRWMCRFPQNLILSFAAAIASYYLVERPMMRFRRREHVTPQSVELPVEVPMKAAA